MGEFLKDVDYSGLVKFDLEGVEKVKNRPSDGNKTNVSEKVDKENNPSPDKAIEISLSPEGIRAYLGYGEVKKSEEDKDLNKIQQIVARLRMIDQQVRAHELAHMSVGGPYAGSPSYKYVKGPDGRFYAVAGEVPIDISDASTPEQTIKKMQTVIAAALAPADPSPQDFKVAAIASQKLMKALMELMKNRGTQNGENTNNPSHNGEINQNGNNPFVGKNKTNQPSGENRRNYNFPQNGEVNPNNPFKGRDEKGQPSGIFQPFQFMGIGF